MYVSRKTKHYNELGTFVLSFWTEVFFLSLSLWLKRRLSGITDLLRLSSWVNQDGKIIEKRKVSVHKTYSFCCPYTTYPPLILPGNSKRLVWCSMEDCVSFCAQWKFLSLFFRFMALVSDISRTQCLGIATAAFLVQLVPSLQLVTKFWP